MLEFDDFYDGPRSIIRDFDISPMMSNDMRDIHFAILDKLTLPSSDQTASAPEEIVGDEPTIVERKQ